MSLLLDPQSAYGNTTQAGKVYDDKQNDAEGEQLIVQWRSAADICQKLPNGLREHEIRAIETFQGPEQLIDDLKKRQNQYLSLEAEDVLSRVSPFFRVLQDLVIVLQEALPRQVESMKLVDGGAYVVLKNAVNSTWALNKIVDILADITNKLLNFEQYTANQKQRDQWRPQLTKIFISMLTIWTKSVRFLTRWGDDHKIKPNWPDLNVAYNDAINAIKDAIEHVKTLNDTAAALSNEKMADLVNALDSASMTDYEEEAGSTFPVWNIPERQDTVFLGRDDDMNQLDEYLKPGPSQMDLKKAVISGMGGIGKSTVAAQYARRSRDDHAYDAIFWIEAEKLSTMRKSFTTVANYLEHPKRSDDEENNKMLVMKWLFRTSQIKLNPLPKSLADLVTGKTWLLIFDNVETIDTLSAFLPHGRGSIIITTRSSTLAKDIKDARSFELSKLSPALSLTLFHSFRRAFDDNANPDEEKDDTARVVDQLDGLALGIKQVATYIGSSQWTIKKYWEKYNVMAQEILKHKAAGTPHTLDTAWNIEFEDLRTTNPDAIKLLSIICLIHPDNIPIHLLVADDDESDIVEAAYEVCESEGRVNSAALILHKLALITKDRENVSIHRLLQYAFRYSKFGLAEKSDLQEALNAAAALLNYRFPNHEGNKHLYGVWGICSAYASSVLSLKVVFESVGKKRKNSLVSSPEFDRLLKNCCWYLYETGQHNECLELLELATKIALDKDSLWYATLCQAYACTYFELNDLPNCRKWNDTCLEIRQKRLKSDDPDLANVHANLGNLFTAEGRFDEAISELFLSTESLDEEVADDRVYIAMRLMMTGRAQFAKAKSGLQDSTTRDFSQAEKTYGKADEIFRGCGPSGAFLHGFLSMDKGNLHLARNEFADARREYQDAHDKMAAASPTSVMVGITQYKLAIAKMKLGTPSDYLEARKDLEAALVSARYHKMGGQEARVCRAFAILFESDVNASEDEKIRQAIKHRETAANLKNTVAAINSSVPIAQPRDEEEEYDRLVCGYYR